MLNLRLSIRNIFRNRIYLALNLIGLSVAFAISIFIFSYVIRELSFNRSYDNYNRIARPITIKKQFGWSEPSVSYPLHLKLKNDIPGIEAAAICRSVRSLFIHLGEENIRIRYAVMATEDIVKIFTPDFVYYDSERFGKDPSSLLISETLAAKLFGKVPDPGTVVEVILGGMTESFTIDGVYKDFPVTSSFQPELLASFDLIDYEFPEGSFFFDFRDHWSKDIFREYLLLEEEADYKSVAERVARLADDQPEDLNYEFALQSFKRMHLHSYGFANDGRRGDVKFVLLFAAVGILILLIAISNYIILSIGASSRRMPEIACRKIFGARTMSIRSFVLMESVLICLLSLPFAYLISKLAANGVSQLFNINMELSRQGNIIIVIIVFLLILLTGIISGSYLAARLGRTTPLFAVKRSASGKGSKVLYKVLITIQIVIFVSLLSASFIVLRQLSFSKNHDPGFDTENLVMAEFPSGIISDFGAFRYELLKNPNIQNISFGGLLPPSRSAMVSIIRPADGGQDIRVEGLSADFGFLNTAGINIIAGRDFNPDLASDSSATIINSALAGKIGAKGENLHEIKSPGNVIGIIEDIQIHSVKEEISPMTVQIAKAKYVSSAFIRILPGTENEVADFLEEAFSDYNPSYLQIASYNDIMKGMYGEEARLGAIVMVFGLVALLLAMLGVYGLSLFLSNELKFDTAVYKVFGASAKDIIRRNTWRYLIYVLLGTIISIPLVVIFMTRWLQQFAYKTSISPWIFVLAFMLSSLVFVLTTFLNTRRLANTNPVDNLRQE